MAAFYSSKGLPAGIIFFINNIVKNGIRSYVLVSMSNMIGTEIVSALNHYNSIHHSTKNAICKLRYLFCTNCKKGIIKELPTRSMFYKAHLPFGSLLRIFAMVIGQSGFPVSAVYTHHFQFKSKPNKTNGMRSFLLSLMSAPSLESWINFHAAPLLSYRVPRSKPSLSWYLVSHTGRRQG